MTELLRVPPHDIEAEIAVLSSIILDNDVIEKTVKILPGGYFYKQAHRYIYKAIIELHTANIVCDMLTIADQLKKDGNFDDSGGMAYLIDVNNRSASSVDINSHISIIRDKAIRRKAIQASDATTQSLYDGDLSETLQNGFDKLTAAAKAAGRPIGRTNSEEVFNYYNDLRITSETDVPDIIPIVKIGKCVICTPENITAISGESKSSKSALANVIIAGAIYQDETKAESFKHLTILKNCDKKAVLHFDTEQSRTIHKIRHQGIINRAGLANEDPAYYYSYNIRKLNIEDYQSITSEICEAAYEAHGGVYMIVIDGIADYIKSVNDEEQSNEIVHYFEQLSVLYQCPIVTIIHLNPNSENKQRGHLGSQLQRKSESVLLIKKDNNTGISWCEGQFLRNAGKENLIKIQFIYDAQKKYHIYAGERFDEKTNELEKLRFYANDIFSAKGSVLRSTAIKQLMELGGWGSRTAEEKLRDMEKLEFIEKENPKGKKASYVSK